MINALLVCFIVPAAAFVSLVISVLVWHLLAGIYGEIVSFFDQYKGERRKCAVEDDYLFTEWVEDFHKEPLSMMREYSDAH